MCVLKSISLKWFDPERKERFISRIAKLVGHPKTTAAKARQLRKYDLDG